MEIYLAVMFALFLIVLTAVFVIALKAAINHFNKHEFAGYILVDDTAFEGTIVQVQFEKEPTNFSDGEIVKMRIERNIDLTEE
jgi:hypothetical protein